MKLIIEWLKRNPCLECQFYEKESNYCQSKKCGNNGNGFVTRIDRLFCEPYKKVQERSE